MVISGIGIHDTQDVIATAYPGEDAAWVALSPKERVPNVNIFIRGNDAFARAQRMADAINAALVEPVTQQEPT